MAKFNNVPKFVEKQIAERRRMKKAATGGIANLNKKNQGDVGFNAARRQYAEKESIKAERDTQIAEKEKKIEERKKERKQVGKLFKKKNERGQPNMGSQLELIMRKYNEYF